MSAVCDCCERTVAHVRGSMWHGTSRICPACFFVWYDRGITDPAELKKTVLFLEAAGQWPFPSQQAGVERLAS